MTPETLKWLFSRVPGFANLSEEERAAIADFSFLWSLFEGLVMNRNCNVQSIRQYVEDLGQQGSLVNFDCETYLGYLINRYYMNGEVTHHFYHLHVERNGNPDEVMEALRNEDASKEVKVIGCLVIVYRLRNNLFHGEKWQHQLQDQRTNFVQANRFLKYLMDLDA